MLFDKRRLSEIYGKDKENRSEEDKSFLYDSFYLLKYFHNVNISYGRECLLEYFEAMEVKVFPANHLLIKEGDKGEFCCVILDGMLKIVNNSDKKKEPLMLKQGELVGDQSLLHGGRRTANVVTATECMLATIYKEDYLRIFKEIKKKERDQYLDFFASTAYFKDLHRNSLERLYYIFELRRCRKNEYVLKRGEIFDDIILIKKGKFALSFEKDVTVHNEYNINYMAEVDRLTKGRFTESRRFELKNSYKVKDKRTV